MTTFWSVAPRRDADEMLARRIADGVVDEVVERQHHRRAVGPDEREVDRHVDFDLELALGQRMPEILQHIVHELGRRDRLERIHLGDVGHARVREQVVDQPRQPPRFLHEQLRIVAHGFAADRPARERVGHRADVRERRLQLVRHR